MGAAGRADAPPHPGRVRGAGPSPGPREAPAAHDRGGPGALLNSVGAARHGQDDPRAAHRPRPRRGVPALQRRARLHQRDSESDGALAGEVQSAQEARPHLRRRAPPPQQGPTGRVPALRRGGLRDFDRGHDGEPVVRGHRPAALPLPGLRAPAPPARGDQSSVEEGAGGRGAGPGPSEARAAAGGGRAHRAGLRRGRPPRLEPPGAGRRPLRGRSNHARGRPERPPAQDAPPRQVRRGALQPDLGLPQVAAQLRA